MSPINLANNSNVLAQEAHVGWGLGLVLALALFIGPLSSIILVSGGAAAKEIAESLGVAPWEPKQTWLSSLVDFVFWCVGIGLAALVLRLAHKLQ